MVDGVLLFVLCLTSGFMWCLDSKKSKLRKPFLYLSVLLILLIVISGGVNFGRN